MLKNGKFIKEPPPKIGVHWTAACMLREKSSEEKLAEALLRGYNPQRSGLFNRLLDTLLRI